MEEERSYVSIFGTSLALLISEDPHVVGMVQIEVGTVMVPRCLDATVVEVEVFLRTPCRVADIVV